MSYNIINLINKAIEIAYKRKKLYRRYLEANKDNLQFKVVATVFINDIEKNIQYYEKFKEKNLKGLEEEIDFFTYDKISSLISLFQSRMQIKEIRTVNELIGFSYDFEKQVIALYIDIQGRLVNKQNDSDKEAYQLLTQFIEEKQKQITKLRLFTKNT